jgi:NTE family protein
MNAVTNQTTPASRNALVLSGGGARAAYQVGVLKAIAELLPDNSPNPFPIICGTSSGAINAATMATHADCFRRGVAQLEQLWGTLRSEQVHRVGYTELMGSTLKLLVSFFRSGITFGRPLSLFDNTPLYHLLMENIQLQFLPGLIERGHLHALCITALGYRNGQSISFSRPMLPSRAGNARGASV